MVINIDQKKQFRGVGNGNFILDRHGFDRRGAG